MLLSRSSAAATTRSFWPWEPSARGGRPIRGAMPRGYWVGWSSCGTWRWASRRRWGGAWSWWAAAMRPWTRRARLCGWGPRIARRANRANSTWPWTPPEPHGAWPVARSMWCIAVPRRRCRRCARRWKRRGSRAFAFTCWPTRSGSRRTSRTGCEAFGARRCGWANPTRPGAGSLSRSKARSSSSNATTSCWPSGRRTTCRSWTPSVRGCVWPPTAGSTVTRPPEPPRPTTSSWPAIWRTARNC